MALRKFFEDAQLAFSRAFQISNEAFGRYEKTEYDEEFIAQYQQIETIYLTSKCLISGLEQWINPNIARKFEEIAEHVEGIMSTSTGRTYKLRVPSKLPSDIFGDAILSAAVDIGRRHKYGQALKKCGEYQRRLAQHEVERNEEIEYQFFDELIHFIQVDWSALQKEMRKLEEARLDYDTAKNKQKRTDPPDALMTQQAEKLHTAYEQQLELTRCKIVELQSAYRTHLLALKRFVATQRKYYHECSVHSEQTLRFLEELIEAP